MNDLVLVQNDRVMADSREVAARFGKRHDNVIRAIDKLAKADPRCLLNFEEGSYTLPETGSQQHRFYRMTRDGFSLLVMRFTGAEALRWQLDFIAAFNTMEQALRGTALPYDRQKDMVLTIQEAFGEDDARATARSFGWPVARKRKSLPRPAAPAISPAVQGVIDAGLSLAREKGQFTYDEACSRAQVVPFSVDSPGVIETVAQSWAAHGIGYSIQPNGCRRYGARRI